MTTTDKPGSTARVNNSAFSASVVVCTHNRASLLPPLVALLREQAVPGGFEILIVDSGSTDSTSKVIATLVTDAEPCVQGLRMNRPGLCAARNRGLEAAGGSVVAFLDDDALPHAGWLEALVDAFSNPSIGAAGGRIMLQFKAPAPAWLTESFLGYLGAYDLGRVSRRVNYTVPMEQYPRGGNLAVRRSVGAGVGGFRLFFGRTGRGLRSDDEADLCYRVEQAGWQLSYVPGATVDHFVFPERVKPQWFMRRFAAQGVSDALFLLANRGVRRALGRLRWYYGAHLLRVPYRPGAAPDPARLLAECERHEAWGYVRGLILGLPVLGLSAVK